MTFHGHDLVVIGSGISGASVARYWADRGKRVLVLERRTHIGGNVYDEVDEHGVLVQRYGPHIFHGNNKNVWEWVERFATWNNFDFHPAVVMNGIETPVPFNFTTIDLFNNPDQAEAIKAALLGEFPGRESVVVARCLASDNPLVRSWAQFLWEHDYKPYTAKQWGRRPEDVDRAVLQRVPITLSYEWNYFPSNHRVAMPVGGFTALVASMLDHPLITVHLDVDENTALEIADGQTLVFGELCVVPVVFTGALDQLFRGACGHLPYRTLTFAWHHDQIPSFQNAPVVSHPQADSYTRITEYTKLPPQQAASTTYAIEYPGEYVPGENDPYYPISNHENAAIYQQYLTLTGAVPNLHLCGRLANYKYYDMSPAIAVALKCAASADLPGSTSRARPHGHVKGTG